MPRYWIGIDQGSTATKACLIDRRGRMRAVAAVPVPTAYPAPDRAEQDGEVLFRSVRTALLRVLDRVDLSEVGGIGIATQRSTFLFWDRGSGRPLTPAISWQDRRGDPLCRRLVPHASLLRRRTGLRLSPHYAASKIRWLLDRAPGLRRGIRTETVRGGTLDAFLLHRLTDGESWSTDPTHAARTLLMDLRRKEWDPTLLDIFAIPPEALPPIRPSTAPAAKLRIRGARIPILATLGDQQAALLGMGCLRDGDLAVNCGTGAFVVMNTGDRPRRGAGLLTSVAWSSPRETRYLLEGTINSAGSALDWLGRIVGGVPRIRRSIPDLDRLPVVVPSFTGLAAPHWASGVRGVIFDLDLDCGADELAVAILAGIACRVREIVEVMEFRGVKIRRIVAGGGLARHPRLLPLQAAFLGRPLFRSLGQEATARGAARLAGHAGGEWDLTAAGSPAAPGTIVRPSLPRASVERYHSRFRDAVDALTRRASHPSRARFRDAVKAPVRHSQNKPVGRDRARGLR